MSSKKWRNAMIILLLLAGLAFAVEYIMNFFLASAAVPDIGIQDLKEEFTSIFRIVIVAALAGAIILVPVWIYKWRKERKGDEYKEPKKGEYTEHGEEKEEEE
ncbi:MAG: hypothetical protein HYW25_01200 [Candidatus Aenigmarchaeota archaeon]|nr:hypothetical protein [Candidatus Aenigmarchaeota archaeon]